jgi:hypothetical protein
VIADIRVRQPRAGTGYVYRSKKV